MFDSRIGKIQKKLLCAVEECLDKADNSLPSCKDELMVYARKYIDKNRKELLSLNEDADFERIGNVLLSDLIFRILSTGNYHFYAGRLNFTGEGFKRIFFYIQKSALDNGFLTQDEYKQNIQAINDNISSVG